MAKKRKLDKLSQDMIQCEKDGFGVHYGAWYAAQNRPVVIEKKNEIPEGWRVCPHCGNPYKPNMISNGRQIYCDIACQKAAQRQRYRASGKSKEYYRKYLEKKSKEVLPDGK